MIRLDTERCRDDLQGEEIDICRMNVMNLVLLVEVENVTLRDAVSGIVLHVSLYIVGCGTIIQIQCHQFP